MLTMQSATASAHPSSSLSQGLWVLVALLFVCLLAALLLRLLARRGIGVPGARGKAGRADGAVPEEASIEVLSTRTLARGQHVHVLRVAGRVLLVGTGASGEPPRLLRDLTRGSSTLERPGEESTVGDGDDGD